MIRERDVYHMSARDAHPRNVNSAGTFRGHVPRQNSRLKRNLFIEVCCTYVTVSV